MPSDWLCPTVCSRTWFSCDGSDRLSGGQPAVRPYVTAADNIYILRCARCAAHCRDLLIGWPAPLPDRLPQTRTNPCEGPLRRTTDVGQRPASRSISVAYPQQRKLIALDAAFVAEFVHAKAPGKTGSTPSRPDLIDSGFPSRLPVFSETRAAWAANMPRLRVPDDRPPAQLCLGTGVIARAAAPGSTTRICKALASCLEMPSDCNPVEERTA